MNTDSCDMRPVENSKDDDAGLDPGDFYMETDGRGQRMFCTCLPNGVNVRLPLRPLVDQSINNGHSWQWDGNETAPTLTPSVHAQGIWHGFIRAGRMVTA